MPIKCPACQHENPDTQRLCIECAAALSTEDNGQPSFTKTLETPVQELNHGSSFANRYQIIEELGKGGMGNVYLVLDQEIDTKVALKLIKPEIALDQKTIDRFRNELKVAREITHKNVCRMYDLNKSENSYFITMEYIEGQDLKYHIQQKGRLTITSALHITKQICAGLSEAHRLGVVHRDLKPSNIMVDKEGKARIMDFGIARSLRTKGITGEGVIIGTPEYMSPEQVDGNEVDQHSDIYSLGVILYEMVTGRLPFGGETALGLALKHKTEAPQDPGKLNPEIPDDLSRLILICLEKDEAKRYQSTEDLLDDLNNIEKGLPLGSKIQPKRESIKSAWQRKKLFIPGSIAALAIIATLGWQLIFQKESHPASLFSKPSLAVLPFEDLSPNKDQEYFCDGMTDDITIKLSQLKELKVISRTSAMLYKNTEKDIKKIGQELGVTAVLEGTVQKAANSIRINAQLINVEDGFHLWADTYDRELKNIFEIQSDIAEKIAIALKTKLSMEEKERLERRPTENLTAYTYYVKGRNFYNQYRKQPNENAIKLFEKALELDANYALAYAGIADAYAQRWRYGYPGKWLDAAIEMSKKALAIDPELEEGHKALGLAYQYKGWFGKALEAYRAAVELNPNFFTAIANIGYTNYWIGELDTALPWLQKARELDPMLAFNYYGLGFLYASLDDQAKAELWLKHALDLQPDLVRAYGKLSQVYLEQGKYDQAFQCGQKILSIEADEFLGLIVTADAALFAGDLIQAQQFFEKSIELYSVRRHLFSGSCNATRLGYIYWKSERRDEAKKLLEQSLDFDQRELEQGNENWVIPYDIFSIHAIQNNKAEAYRWLKKAIDAGWRNFRLGSMDPMSENLHDDEQYLKMIADVKKMVMDMRKRTEQND